jgi:hypothetical protein
VPFLGPGVGEEDEDAVQRGFRQAVEQEAGIVDEEPDIGEPVRLDPAQQAGDAVEIGLDADQPDLGIGRRLPRQVLTAAEADLEPDRLAGWAEEVDRV